MSDERRATNLRRARVVLAVFAWAMTALVGSSMLAAILSIVPWPAGLDITPLLQRLRATGPATAMVIAAGLCGAAIWHAALDPRCRRGERALLLGTLLIGNVVAALVYYFLSPAADPAPDRTVAIAT